MQALKTILKIESRLAIRGGDSIFFGILFPVGVVLLLGAINGSKIAFEGANYTFMQQNFGAVVSFGICATGLMGLPLTLADYRDKKILKRFKATPISPSLLLFVQIIISFVIAVTSGIAVYLVSALLFGYKMIGSFGAFILAYILVTLAIYGLGMLLASLSPNIKTANLLCTIIYFPMVFLSGATVPYTVERAGFLFGGKYPLLHSNHHD